MHKWAWLIPCLVLFSHSGQAQYQEDFGIWTSLGYEKEIFDDLDAIFDAEFRFEDNARELRRFFTDAELQYHVSDHFRVSGIYRRIVHRKGDNLFGNRHRFMFEAEVGKRFRRFEVELRQRFRREKRAYGYFDIEPQVPDYYTRSKIDVSYTVNRYYQLWASVDFRFMLKDPEVPDYRGFERLRARFGIDRQLNEFEEVSFFLLLNQDYNIPEAEKLFVVGVEYKFTDGFSLFPD